jgi:hypothetical protein
VGDTCHQEEKAVSGGRSSKGFWGGGHMKLPILDPPPLKVELRGGSRMRPHPSVIAQFVGKV